MTTAVDLSQWLYIVLAGMNSPGTIPRGGVKGFARETGWDIKMGKGVKGATLTLKTQPPCEGSIIFQLIGPGGFYNDGTPSIDFALWDTFAANVLAIPVTQQQSQGLAIYYPQFSSINLNFVVVKKFAGPEHIGKGLYHARIELIEWSTPPAVSIVSTPSSAKPDAPDTDVPAPVDPRITALQAQIAAASGAAAAPEVVAVPVIQR